MYMVWSLIDQLCLGDQSTNDTRKLSQKTETDDGQIMLAEVH